MYHRLSFFLAAGKPAPGGGSNVYLDPTSNLPGTTGLENLINGVGYWALIAAMLGVVVGAVFWAFGHFSQNYQQAVNGRKGVLVSLLAAVLIGAAPFLINHLFGQGSTFQ